MTAQVIGLAAAVEYLQALGMDKVEAHEQALTGYALEKLAEIPGVTVIGPPDTVARGGAISFTVEGIHPHDVGQVLDDLGIAVRVGHHCAWPVIRRYGVPATTRATFYVHTGYDDIDALADGVRAAQKFFGVGHSGELMQLENMYQEIILDHYRNPHGRGLREPFEAEVHHVNPTCGDEVTLRVHLEGDTIADVSYEGMGCSISQASVSAMYDLVIGKTVQQALETGEHFMTLMQAKGDPSVAEKLEDELEDAVAFAGVSKYPARIKCALMGWMALKDASARALSVAQPPHPQQEASHERDHREPVPPSRRDRAPSCRPTSRRCSRTSRRPCATSSTPSWASTSSTSASSTASTSTSRTSRSST